MVSTNNLKYGIYTQALKGRGCNELEVNVTPRRIYVCVRTKKRRTSIGCPHIHDSEKNRICFKVFLPYRAINNRLREDVNRPTKKGCRR